MTFYHLAVYLKNYTSMINVISVTLNLTLRVTRTYCTWSKSFLNKNVIFHNYNKIQKNRFLEMATIQDKYTSCPRTLPPPTALVLLATGTEELELVTIVDVLRRGNVEVTISGMDTTEVTKCRCDTKIVPDTALCQAICNAPYGVIVLPGGLEAAKTFLESKILCSMLKDQEASKGLIAGICAAPMVFKAHGICKGYHITCYPALAAELCIGNEYKYHDKRPVVVDRNLITSRGPATSMNFAFTILGLLKGDIIAQEVANAMLFDYCSSKALQNINE